MSYRVPFIKPSFPAADQVAKDYQNILDSNRFTNFGPFERKFAEQIAAYVGPDFVAATFSSATSALMAAILAILGKGDNTRYVLVPSFTFAAAAHCLEWCGYKPLFIDIENEGLHMDVRLAEKALSEKKYEGKVAAILFCNSFGVGSTDIGAWEKLAHRFELPLIIDSAAGFGSMYSKKRKVGAAGTCEIFSFHATKPFAIGEGGAVVTGDRELGKKLVSIQNFGFDSEKNTTMPGFNGKLSELAAAIGLRQFERLGDILGTRKEVLKQYMEKLDKKRFMPQKNAELASLCFATFLVKDGKRDEYVSRLHESGIEAKKYYGPALHRQPHFKRCDIASPLKITESIANKVISLPVHDNMDPKDIDLIAGTLNG